MSAGSSPRLSFARIGPYWVAVGLVLMISSSFYPTGPVVTALGLIALGTIEIDASHQPKSARSLQLILLHGTTYAMLYALFIGARLHASTNAPLSSLNTLTTLDLAASTLPMAIALRRILACLRASVLPRP
jgi:hypothetical protein